MTTNHLSESSVCTVAVCAGSGASVLRGVKADLHITGTGFNRKYNIPADLIPDITVMKIHVSGEMSHHEVLDTVARGTSVLLSDHSNSERGFLTVFREKLAVRLPDSVTVVVSKADRDPLEVV